MRLRQQILQSKRKLGSQLIKTRMSVLRKSPTRTIEMQVGVRWGRKNTLRRCVLYKPLATIFNHFSIPATKK